MIQRMIGAALFNRETYEEIEADQGALGQAMGVVLLVTLCGIIGGIIGGFFEGEAVGLGILLGIISGFVFGVVRWAIWVSVMYLVGGKMLRTGDTETTWSEVGRVVGFAYSPGVLSLFTFVPVVGGLFWLVGVVWQVAAVVVAVRQAMDFQSTGRAIGVVLLSAVIAVIPLIIVGIIQLLIFGGPEVQEVESGVRSLLALI